MDEITNVFAGLSQSVANAHPRNDSDYINPNDELLYCGVCHTPKQCRVPFRGNMYVQFCICSCEAKRIEAEREALHQQQLNAEICHLKSLSGMTRQQLSECNFEKYGVTADNEKPLKICRKYVDNFGIMLEKNQGLLFWGDVGTGKTFSAECIANALLDSGVPVVMTSFAKLLGRDKGFGVDEDFIAELNRAKLLIIDDLGAERNTDFALEKVYNIIDSRYSAGLPMILTTNLDLNEIQQCKDIRYQRVYERILEVCYPVKFEGKSHRKREAKDRFAEMRELFEA
ncbi:MAG: ATP-binding protein [Oscillospiraceae bacterium]|nr:ATP-binding protein [Oscillospiraceae bacterium]